MIFLIILIKKSMVFLIDLIVRNFHVMSIDDTTICTFIIDLKTLLRNETLKEMQSLQSNDNFKMYYTSFFVIHTKKNAQSHSTLFILADLCRAFLVFVTRIFFAIPSVFCVGVRYCTGVFDLWLVRSDFLVRLRNGRCSAPGGRLARSSARIFPATAECRPGPLTAVTRARFPLSVYARALIRTPDL